MQIGDKIKVINDDFIGTNDKKPNIKLNEEYELKLIVQCACKELHFNIGLPMELNYVRCYKCAAELPEDSHYCHSSRFVKV